MGLEIKETTIRRILIESLGMAYKKGLARIVNFDEEFQDRIKQWFAIKLWKVLDRFELLINIDESSFSRLTKKDFSWIPKGKEQIIKNIWFRNSWSLMTAITTSGSVLAAKSDCSITSELFIEFLTKLDRFVQDEKTSLQNCLIILDNASIHRSAKAREYMKNEGLNIAFIPQYSLEMAPVEHYFSKLKQVVVDQWRGKSVDWKSSESNKLLKRWMLSIPSKMVRRIWTSFTKELSKYID